MAVDKQDHYEGVCNYLRRNPQRWLVTGCAGFIGSNLLEALLKLDQYVVGIDNFATGYRSNLLDVKDQVTKSKWERFEFIEGDISTFPTCQTACTNIDIVLHQAAVGSVPRSIADPINTNTANITGFLNMLVAAREANIQRFVFASSSSVYGDHQGLPKTELCIGRPLSPYAVTKYANELYAEVFSKTYGIYTIGLRYFNVFGRRQDPNSAYAAVIPKWINHLLAGKPCAINGDGETSRDFCYVDNVVQANILAALVDNPNLSGCVFNVAVGARTTLNQLFTILVDTLARKHPWLLGVNPQYEDFRDGDVRHSQADISKARELLGYNPTYSVARGLSEAIPWYTKFCPLVG